MTNEKPNTSFWFGFALGSLTLTAIAYLMGTKKGREKLKQLIEYADTLEDMPAQLFELLPSIKEMLKKGTDHVEEVKDSFPEQIGKSLESIIEKVKSSSEEKKEPKKYFIKE